jgi:hypothetical protein
MNNKLRRLKMFNVRMNKFGNKANGNFSMTFANGYSVSVAMGEGTYSDGNSEDGFTSVEVAAWDADGNWRRWWYGDTVAGWQSPEKVLAIMNKVAAM